MTYSIPDVQSVKSVIETTLKDVVIPVLEDNPQLDINQIGTSTLIEHKNKLVLLSAQHVFDGVKAEQIAVPSDCMGAKIVPLWPFEIVVSDAKNDDLIGLILNDAVAMELRAGWRAINSTTCALPSGDRAYAVGGYPSALVSKFGSKMGGTLLIVYADLMAVAPINAALPVDECDIFLEYNEEGTKNDGAKMLSPRLEGVSGAGIWEVATPEQVSFWTPQSALALVGVETSTRHFQYIRGKSWLAVAQRLLAKI